MRCYSIFDELLREVTNANYPVTNGGTFEDGTPFLQLAVTGCGLEHITVKFDEHKRQLIIKATPPKLAGYYKWQKIATGNFTYRFWVGDAYEVDKVTLTNGLLTITFKPNEKEGGLKVLPIN